MTSVNTFSADRTMSIPASRNLFANTVLEVLPRDTTMGCQYRSKWSSAERVASTTSHSPIWSTRSPAKQTRNTSAHTSWEGSHSMSCSKANSHYPPTPARQPTQVACPPEAVTTAVRITGRKARRIITSRYTRLSINPPPSGYCENPECGHDGDSKWHWSSKHKFYICDACKVFARDNDDELRVPQRHQRTKDLRANDLCQSTTASKWAWEESLRAFVCSPCSKFQKRNRRWPDRISGTDGRKWKSTK
jgi:hypothetical protein